MTDLKHATGTPEAAVRSPVPAASEAVLEAPDLRPDVFARTASLGGGAGTAAPPRPGPGPSPHGLPPGAVGAAALLGIQRAAGNRAAASLVLGPRRSPPATTVPRAGQGGFASIQADLEPGPDEIDPGRDVGAVPDIDALHAAGPPQMPPAHAAQRLAVQRDGGQPATPTFSIPIEPDSTKKDLGSSASYVKGSIGFKGEVKGEFVPKGSKEGGPVGAGTTSNIGGQAEITLAEQKGYAIFDSLGIDKVKETLSFELSKKKLDVGLGAEAAVKTRYPWLTGVVGLKFTAVGIEWEKVQEAVAAGVEITGGLNGEGQVNLNSATDVKYSVKVVAFGEVHPNWPRIAAEVGKRVATEGGKAAVQATTTAAGTEIIVLDMAAVASAAAVIVIPLAAAIAMGYGAFQGMKNAKAAREAANYGVQMRQKAEECAKGFARTLTGHSPGSDEGSAEAEAQIQATMASTRATREMVVAAATQEQGGYGAIYAKNLKRIKEKLYAEGCARYDEQSKEDWGFIEDFGPDWGMRGVFRSTFRIVLFGGSQ